jgi:hypothetical protein
VRLRPFRGGHGVAALIGSGAEEIAKIGNNSTDMMRMIAERKLGEKEEKKKYPL